MARFVYWRTPEGRPYRGTDGKHAPVVLLKELGENATLGHDGSISYSNFMPHMHELAIQSAAVTLQPDNSELGEEDSKSIVRRAILNTIRNAGGRTALTPPAVLREADRLASDLYRRPIEEYDLVTTVSVAALPFARATIENCKVLRVNPRTSPFLLSDSFSSINRIAAYRNHIQKSKYRLVRVKTAGRCVHQAVENALKAVHLLRGLWTLFSTYRQTTIHFGIRRRIPLGVIHVGPIHVLRKPDGELVQDGCWFEPDYVEDQALFRPPSGWQRIEKNRKWALRRISRLRYGDEIKQLIVRYVKALDQSNLDAAFLQLWSILESLTGTVGGRYEKTIQRAARPLGNRLACEEQLRILRLQRNQVVHAAQSSGDRDQVVYLIKSFVEPHLAALIQNGFKVHSIEEFVEYLSMPVDSGVLEKRRRQFTRMLSLSRPK